MKLGSRVKHFRKINNLTQQELAMGICSISYLSKIENDAIEPASDVVDSLCDRLGISPKQVENEEQQFEQLSNALEELNKLIRAKEKEGINSLYDQIKDEYSSLSSPQSLVLINMFGLRISLLESNKQKAKNYYKQIKELSEYVIPSYRANYYRFCGLYHYLYESLDKSLEYYKLAEEYIQINEKEEVFYQLALVYNRLQNISLSTFYLSKALEIFVQKMDYDLCTNCYLLLGVNYLDMGAYDKAIDNYESLLQRLKTPNDNKVIAKVYNNMGIIYSSMGNSLKAVSFFEKSLGLKVERIERINTIYLLAREYFKKEATEETLKWLHEGILLSLEYQIDEYHIKFTILEYQVHKDTQSSEFESYLLDIAIPFFKTKGENDVVGEYVKLLAVYYEDNRQYKKAYELLKNLIENRGM